MLPYFVHRHDQRCRDPQSFMLPTLPEKYYLAHARELFGFVLNECQHLLEEAHTAYIETFATMSEDAQCMLVRCLTRKHRFLKTSSLVYPEISSTSNALKELTAQSYVSTAMSSDWPDLVGILTKPQLASVLRDAQCSITNATPKSVLVELAQDVVNPDSPQLESLFQNYVVRRQSHTIDYIFFLFFGDLRHRFQKFAMRDLGVLKTRKTIGKTVARFDCKVEALSAFALQVRRRDFMLKPDQVYADTAHYLLNTEAIGHSAIETKNKLLLAVGNSVAEHNSELAIQLWRASNDTQATVKWIRETYKHDKNALKAELESMRKAELAAPTQLFIEDFYARKYSGKRTSVFTDILRESARTIPVDEAYLNDAEEGVIQHYYSQNVQALFTENKLWRVLFAFSFWDLLFGKAHVQHSEFDRLPALLRNGSFYQTFQSEIENRLVCLESPEVLLSQFTRLATLHYGKSTGLFRWNASLLDAVTPCLLHSPRDAIAKVLRRMAQDYRHTKDGYPDLMVIDEGKLRFEEVKAPGDVLRPNQLVSINRLRRAGFQVDVTQVDWATNPNQIYAVVDIETTGSRKSGSAITEIAVVRVQNQRVISEWSSLINPQRHVPAYITKLTGIDNTMVASAPVFAEIADKLSEQLKDSIFVAHNVGFDYGFIKAAYESIGKSFRKPKYCTVKNARRAFPGLKSYSLGALTEYFDIDLNGAHRALNDARATADLLRLIQSENESLAL